MYILYYCEKKNKKYDVLIWDFNQYIMPKYFTDIDETEFDMYKLHAKIIDKMTREQLYHHYIHCSTD